MPDASGADPLTDELATLLFALDAGALTTAGITRRITRAIGSWAIARGWSVRTEARVAIAGTPTYAGQPGYVDVVIGRGGAGRDVAIEIDSADKPWSAAKLQHAAAAGLHAIWVRWGDDDWAGIYDDIDVIQLRLSRAPERRSSGRGQLSLWPARRGR